MDYKLLQINTVVNTGSTGRITEEIGYTAIVRGWKSYIAYGRNKFTSQSELIKIGNAWNIWYHGIQTRLFDKHGLASKRATKKLVNEILMISPDVIHLHNIHGYYLNYKILFEFLEKSKIPIVWTFHDCWPITGHCSYFSLVDCEKWKSYCFNCPQRKEYPESWIKDRSINNFILKKKIFTSLPNLTLVSVSTWLSDILRESFMQNYTIKVIHNGVNTSVFKPYEENRFRFKYHFENKFILLGVANEWSPRKGLKDFIEISYQLNKEFQIILVGLSPKSIKNLPSNILGIEKTDSINELAIIYSASDVFINPTYEDNFPTTNLEALACGTPVITYKTGGSPEALDNSTGFVVEKGDISQLMDAINKIKESGKQSYKRACVNRANNLFNNEKCFQEYLKLYESLICKKLI